MTRRLVARIDIDEFDNHEVRLEEWTDDRVEVVGFGLFISDPGHEDMQNLRDDLAEMAQRHCLVQSEDDPDWYEREI